MNVLANDGISQEGVEKLTAAGFNTILESVDQLHADVDNGMESDGSTKILQKAL